jgi:hypothetical protein
MARKDEENASLGIDGKEFRARLAEEIKRSQRYEHPFAVLLLRPPMASTGQNVLGSPWFDSLICALREGCDVVAVFDDGPVVAVLLPETRISGAGALLERLSAAIGDSKSGWQCAVFEYPHNREKIEHFLDRAA